MVGVLWFWEKVEEESQSTRKKDSKISQNTQAHTTRRREEGSSKPDLIEEKTWNLRSIKERKKKRGIRGLWNEEDRGIAQGASEKKEEITKGKGREIKKRRGDDLKDLPLGGSGIHPLILCLVDHRLGVSRSLSFFLGLLIKKRKKVSVKRGRGRRGLLCWWLC